MNDAGDVSCFVIVTRVLSAVTHFWLLLQKQIEALKQLCLKAGIRDADIAACSATREYKWIIATRLLIIVAGSGYKIHFRF